MTAETTSVHERLALTAWKRMKDVIGLHTAMILVQRAIWLTRREYEEADLISFSENGPSLTGLASLDEVRRTEVAVEFFSSIMAILSNLVGQDMARKVAVEVDAVATTE